MKVTCPYSTSPADLASDVNPCLRIDDIPDNACSLVVTAQNVHTGKFHWVIYNIPVTDTIDEGFRKGIEAVNDFNRRGFKTPDPPAGETELLFSVYALGDVLHVRGNISGLDIRRALYRYLIDVAEVIYFTDPLTPVGHNDHLFDLYDLPPGLHD